MSAIKTALGLIKTPGKMVAPLAQRGFLDWMSDEAFLKLRFKAEMGYSLDLEQPQTYNEKLQWLKLHDRNPLYAEMVDKYRAKEYVAKIIGEEYIIPTLGVYYSFEEIDFDMLPESFVLKCTHDSGSIYICKNKSDLNKERAAYILKKGLKRKPMRYGREWPYSQVEPRIIAEQYMEDESGCELKDYKIFTFSGKAAMVQVDYGRFREHKRNLYTLDWNFIDAMITYKNDPNHIIPRPERLELMIALAEKLSTGFPHIRVDFYSIGNKVYFGEMTLYHGAGFEKFSPVELERQLGDLIVLTDRK